MNSAASDTSKTTVRSGADGRVRATEAESRASLAVLMTHDLRTIEHTIDDTLTAYGLGLANMTEGRRRAGLAAQAGQEGLEAFARALALTVDARSEIVRAHDAFAREARKLRIPITMNPLETKPDTPETVGKPKG